MCVRSAWRGAGSEPRAWLAGEEQVQSLEFGWWERRKPSTSCLAIKRGSLLVDVWSGATETCPCFTVNLSAV